MANEPIYGSEALRRFREQQEAAKPTKAPTPEPEAPAPEQRTQMRTAVNPDEQSILVDLARAADVTLSNYFRAAVGMPVIAAGRPTAKQEAERAAWVRLKRAELDARNK